MTDWKDALSALAGMETPAEEKNNTPQEVNRKKRTGVVFSTNPDFAYEEESNNEEETVARNQQKLRLSMERAGRGGKTVTLIKGFVGTDSDLQTLAKLLKQKCGVGGTAKDGEIIIQGDHRQRLVEILKKEGYTQTK